MRSGTKAIWKVPSTQYARREYSQNEQRIRVGPSACSICIVPYYGKVAFWARKMLSISTGRPKPSRFFRRHWISARKRLAKTQAIGPVAAEWGRQHGNWATSCLIGIHGGRSPSTSLAYGGWSKPRTI